MNIDRVKVLGGFDNMALRSHGFGDRAIIHLGNLIAHLLGAAEPLTVFYHAQCRIVQYHKDHRQAFGKRRVKTEGRKGRKCRKPLILLVELARIELATS